MWDVVGIGAMMPFALILGMNGADHPRLDRFLGEQICDGLLGQRKQLNLTFLLPAASVMFCYLKFRGNLRLWSWAPQLAI